MLHQAMSTNIDSYIQARVEILTLAMKGQQFRMSNANTPADSLMADAFMRFASAVFDKAIRAREKYGFHELGWATPDWQAELQRGLAEHVQKGDPRDVAVYAMFAWFHGWSTALPIPELEGEIERLLAALPTSCSPTSGEYFKSEGVEAAVRKLHQQVMYNGQRASNLAHENKRLIDETHRWSEAVKKLEAERAANPSAIAQIRAAAAPFVKHYASWMDAYPDETASSVFPDHTIGQIRNLRKALNSATKEERQPDTSQIEQAKEELVAIRRQAKDYRGPVGSWNPHMLQLSGFELALKTLGIDMSEE